MDVFAFQLLFVQKMLLSGREGGEKIEKSINQAQLCNKPDTSSTVRSFCWEIGKLSYIRSPLLSAAITLSPATVVETIGKHGNEPEGH